MSPHTAHQTVVLCCHSLWELKRTVVTSQGVSFQKLEMIAVMSEEFIGQIEPHDRVVVLLVWKGTFLRFWISKLIYTWWVLLVPRAKGHDLGFCLHLCVFVKLAETCARPTVRPPPPPCLHVQPESSQDGPPAGLPAGRVSSLPLPHGCAVPLRPLLHPGYGVWNLLMGWTLSFRERNQISRFHLNDRSQIK